MGIYSGKNVRLHMICIVVIFIGTIFFCNTQNWYWGDAPSIFWFALNQLACKLFGFNWQFWGFICSSGMANEKLLHFVDLMFTFYRNLKFILLILSTNFTDIWFILNFVCETIFSWKKNSKSSNKPMEL